MKPNQWLVQIQGGPSDLDHLARHFTALPRWVIWDERDGGYLYVSDAFAACSTSDEVLAVADQELAELSGVLKVTRESPERLRSGAVYRQNAAGGRDVFVHIRETLEARVELFEPTVTVTDPEGKVITKSPPPARTVRLAHLAAANPSVAKAVRLHAAEDSTTWVGLYRVYEVIEADTGGQAALATMGWSSATDQRRFKQSANSVTVAGDAARHGKESTMPPEHPMSHEEAVAYVHVLMEAWLASKGGG
jgi:hypothetical protein